MFPRLTAAIHRRGSAPPDLPGIFSPKRMRRTGAACLWCLVFPFDLAAQTNMVFESGTARLEVVAQGIEPVVMHGRPSVQFQLDASSSAAFGDLTGGIVGQPLAVLLCDRQLLSVVVRERLEGRGILNLPTLEAAIAVADVVQGKAGCATLAEHFDE